MSELVSTRDPGQTALSYSDVLLEGLAPDGGLYVPRVYPRLSDGELKQLIDVPYIELYSYVKSLIVGEDQLAQSIRELAGSAYCEQNFPGAENGNVVPVSCICGVHYLQNLSGGPTAAFKDMALQPLAQEMHHLLSSRGKRLDLLGATSGDTGSAAEAAIKGLGSLSLFMLSPVDGMSKFQKAQMGALSGDNIHNISIPGRFDDCQDLVKGVNEDPEFADIGAVNSINWGRIASQVPYYVSGYLQTIEMSGGTIGDPVDFVVPSGNFGNALAGYVARAMGVPVRRLIIATNENNVLHKLIQTGKYEYSPAEITSSPSMDISKASNFERLLYDLMGRDATNVVAFMEQFKEVGHASFSDFGVSPKALRDMHFDSGSSNAAERLDSIVWTYKISGTVIDPHTADAVTVAREKYLGDGVPIVSMATALPVKFEGTIREALGFVPERQERFAGLEEKTLGGFVNLSLSADALKEYIRRHRLK